MTIHNGYTVFLDRDGVINQDSPAYIKSPGEFEFIPRSPEAIASLTQAGFRVVLVTNQSAIARNMFTLETLAAIFEKMKTGIANAGGRVDDIFFCPHHPDDGCACRKPAPGMIFDAVKKHDLRLSKCIMVGDSAKDIKCARNAGCARAVLVKTGNGVSALESLSAENTPLDFVADDLYGAAAWIIRNFK